MVKFVLPESPAGSRRAAKCEKSFPIHPDAQRRLP